MSSGHRTSRLAADLESDRVDHAQAGQEDQLGTGHAIADVVEPVEQGRAGQARGGPEVGAEPVLDEASEEHRLEDADDQRHHQQRDPALRCGQPVAPKRDGELGGREDRCWRDGAVHRVRVEAEVGQRAVPGPDRVGDRSPTPARRAAAKLRNSPAVRSVVNPTKPSRIRATTVR